MEQKEILFVCTGNTCRSPMAEALARLLLVEIAPKRADISFKSAGIAAWPGDNIASQAAAVLRQFEIDASRHRVCRLEPEQIQHAFLVLTMTAQQRDKLRQWVPHQAHKIQTLARYAGSQGDVPDPFGRDEAYYRQVADQLAALLHTALRRLLQQC